MNRKNQDLFKLLFFFDSHLLNRWDSEQDSRVLARITCVPQFPNTQYNYKINVYLAAYIRLTTLAICELIEPAISRDIYSMLLSYAKAINLKVNPKLTNLELVEILDNTILQNRIRLPQQYICEIEHAKKLMGEFQYSCVDHILHLCRDDFAYLSIQSITELKEELKKFFPFSEFKLLEQIFFNQSVTTRCIAQIVDDYICKNKKLRTEKKYKEISENLHLACNEIKRAITELKKDKALVSLLSNYTQHFCQLLQIEADVKQWKKASNKKNYYSESLLIAQVPYDIQQPSLELFIKDFEKKLQQYLRVQQIQYIRHLAIRPEQINYRLALFGSVNLHEINNLWREYTNKFGLLFKYTYIDISSRKINQILTNDLSWAYWLDYFVRPNLNIRSLSRSRKK